jgi:hypothetical protein
MRCGKMIDRSASGEPVVHARLDRERWVPLTAEISDIRVAAFQRCTRRCGRYLGAMVPEMVRGPLRPSRAAPTHAFAVSNRPVSKTEDHT